MLMKSFQILPVVAALIDWGILSLCRKGAFGRTPLFLPLILGIFVILVAIACVVATCKGQSGLAMKIGYSVFSMLIAVLAAVFSLIIFNEILYVS